MIGSPLIEPNSAVPKIRVRVLNDQPNQFNHDGDFVLYWMISARRCQYNFGLQRAVDWAKSLNKPLVVFEALRASYQWNSDRFHAFVIQGMADNCRALAKSPVTYYPYVEPTVGAERGLLATLAKSACLIVSDDFPAFFIPRLTAIAARVTGLRMELIDSNGLYPMRQTERVFSRAVDFRRHLQKELLPHLKEQPLANPLANLELPRLKTLPENISVRWPCIDPVQVAATPASLHLHLQNLPINHRVTTTDTIGGSVAAAEQAISFLNHRLPGYIDSRNEPEKMMTSRLSPYLHFGHFSVHQLFQEIVARASWTSEQTPLKATGKSSGWWGMEDTVESFLDEVITWREIGYNMCANSENFEQYESLPTWAQKTLAEHENDPRDFLYSLDQFEQSQTHDSLWNAAQTQLVRTGVIHNYLRMLWGKKILEWSPTPHDALATMIELNNKWGLDGRNPNSYSGIFWVLGRYDRAWGERPVFGKIRYMSSDNTARKVKVKSYVKEYS